MSLSCILLFLFVLVRNRDLSWPEEMNTLVATRVFRERSNTGMNACCLTLVGPTQQTFTCSKSTIETLEK